MATRTIISHTCDRHPERTAANTLLFQWAGALPHEIDLCTECVLDISEELRTGRRMTQATRPKLTAVPSVTRPARRDAEQTAAIRTWAKANGFAISNRGRIPGEIEQAYNRGNAVLDRLRA